MPYTSRDSEQLAIVGCKSMHNLGKKIDQSITCHILFTLGLRIVSGPVRMPLKHLSMLGPKGKPSLSFTALVK